MAEVEEKEMDCEGKAVQIEEKATNHEAETAKVGMDHDCIARTGNMRRLRVPKINRCLLGAFCSEELVWNAQRVAKQKVCSEPRVSRGRSWWRTPDRQTP